MFLQKKKQEVVYLKSLNVLKEINKRQSDEILRLTECVAPEPIKDESEEKIDVLPLEKEISDLKLRLIDA